MIDNHKPEHKPTRQETLAEFKIWSSYVGPGQMVNFPLILRSINALIESGEEFNPTSTDIVNALISVHYFLHKDFIPYWNGEKAITDPPEWTKTDSDLLRGFVIDKINQMFSRYEPYSEVLKQSTELFDTLRQPTWPSHITEEFEMWRKEQD